MTQLEKAASKKAPPKKMPGYDIRDHLLELISKIQAGAEDALADLYDATVGQLYALAYAIVRDPDEAEDVVSKTYADAWKLASRYNPDRGSVFTWLSVMCRSRALDSLRTHTQHAVSLTEQQTPIIDESRTRPDDLLNLLQNQGRVYAAMTNLPATHRHLVAMSFLEGLSHQEIATHTGMALGTVKSHIRSALLQLKEELVKE